MGRLLPHLYLRVFLVPSTVAKPQIRMPNTIVMRVANLANLVTDATVLLTHGRLDPLIRGLTFDTRHTDLVYCHGTRLTSWGLSVPLEV